MATTTSTEVARVTNVAINPATDAAELYRSARVAGFPANPSLNLRRYPGKTIEHLTLHARLSRRRRGVGSRRRAADRLGVAGGDARCAPEQRPRAVLPRRQSDGGLRAVTDSRGAASAARVPGHGRRHRRDSRSVAVRSRVDGLLSAAARAASCSSTESRPAATASTRNTDSVATTDRSTQNARRSITRSPPTRRARTASASSPRAGRTRRAVFYHELCEARTDPDVEDAIRAGNSPHADDFLGWYSPRGGEIGDIPLEEAGANLTSVMKEVKLASGGKTVPVQLMWSNAVAGPEGPIAHKHP